MSKTLYEAYKYVKDTQGTNAKMESLAKAVEDNVHFRDLLWRTYAGNLNYYVKKFNMPKPSGAELDDVYNEFTALLNDLCHRKITGNMAILMVEDFARRLNERGQELVRCVFDRNLDIGLNVKNINKVVPKLLPSSSYMRCSGYDGDAIQKWLDAGDVIFAQEKMDGMFVVINPNSRSIRTRSGKYFNPDLFEAVWNDLKEQAKGKVLHGEVITYDEQGNQNPREISNGILNSTLKKETPLGSYKIFVWDAVDFTSEKGYKDPTDYAQRFENLLKASNEAVVVPVKSKIVKNMTEIQKFYHEIVSNGGEGLVIKNGKAPWENKTSKFQIKMKNETDLDLKIVGFTQGEGKFKGLIGAITCESADGLLSVNVSGMSDTMRKDITERQNELIGTIVCVKANSIMENADSKASLFLPRFVELREDKTEADDIERIKELFKTF